MCSSLFTGQGRSLLPPRRGEQRGGRPIPQKSNAASGPLATPLKDLCGGGPPPATCKAAFSTPAAARPKVGPPLPRRGRFRHGTALFSSPGTTVRKGGEKAPPLSFLSARIFYPRAPQCAKGGEKALSLFFLPVHALHPRAPQYAKGRKTSPLLFLSARVLYHRAPRCAKEKESAAMRKGAKNTPLRLFVYLCFLLYHRRAKIDTVCAPFIK